MRIRRLRRALLGVGALVLLSTQVAQADDTNISLPNCSTATASFGWYNAPSSSVATFRYTICSLYGCGAPDTTHTYNVGATGNTPTDTFNAPSGAVITNVYISITNPGHFYNVPRTSCR